MAFHKTVFKAPGPGFIPVFAPVLALWLLAWMGCASEPEVTSYRSVKARVMNEVGLESFRKGDLATALSCFQKALEHAEASDNQAEAVRAHINIAQLLASRDEGEESYAHLMEALRIAEDLDEDEPRYSALEALGGYYFKTGDYAKAETLFLDALDIAEDLDTRDQEAMTLNDLGAVYKEQGRIDEAVETLNQALFLFDNLEGRSALEGRGSVRNNLAAVRCIQGRYQDAYDLLANCLIIYQQVGDPECLITAHTSMARLLEDWGRQSDALLRYERAFGVAKEVPDRRWMEICLQNILRLSRTLGEDLLYQEYSKVQEQLMKEFHGNENAP